MTGQWPFFDSSSFKLSHLELHQHSLIITKQHVRTLSISFGSASQEGTSASIVLVISRQGKQNETDYTTLAQNIRNYASQASTSSGGIGALGYSAIGAAALGGGY